MNPNKRQCCGGPTISGGQYRVDTGFEYGAGGELKLPPVTGATDKTFLKIDADNVVTAAEPINRVLAPGTEGGVAVFDADGNTLRDSGVVVTTDTGKQIISGSISTYDYPHGVSTGTMVAGDGAGGALHVNGVDNLITGVNASTELTFNQQNAVYGSSAGKFNSGGLNTFMGTAAGRGDTGVSTGSQNTFIGCYAGISCTTGNGNVCLGYSTDTTSDGVNQVTIGNGVTAAVDNECVIGNNTTDHIRSDARCDLGTNDERFKDLYLVGSVFSLGAIKPPLLTTTQRKVLGPNPGDLVYDTDLNRLLKYDGHWDYIAQEKIVVKSFDDTTVVGTAFTVSSTLSNDYFDRATASTSTGYRGVYSRETFNSTTPYIRFSIRASAFVGSYITVGFCAKDNDLNIDTRYPDEVGVDTSGLVYDLFNGVAAVSAFVPTDVVTLVIENGKYTYYQNSVKRHGPLPIKPNIEHAFMVRDFSNNSSSFSADIIDYNPVMTVFDAGITFLQPRCELSWENTANTLTVVNTGTWYKTLAGNTVNSPHNVLFTTTGGVTTWKATYDGDAPKVMHAGCTLSATFNTSGQYEFALFKSTATTPATTYVTGSLVRFDVVNSVDWYTTAIHSFIEMNKGDYVELRVRRIEAPSNTTVSLVHCNLFIVAMGAAP